ncbi:hypothetical protein [Paraburkholderia haematera]|uniref:hypothetical protein n=1 Tax=Paraburkholderia haematera TaxID=2793077 RepID=UPI001B8CEF2E|nr:hypothetical protein [Paraburkholderia haematera]
MKVKIAYRARPGIDPASRESLFNRRIRAHKAGRRNTQANECVLSVSGFATLSKWVFTHR